MHRGICKVTVSLNGDDYQGQAEARTRKAVAIAEEWQWSEPCGKDGVEERGGKKVEVRCINRLVDTLRVEVRGRDR